MGKGPQCVRVQKKIIKNDHFSSLKMRMCTNASKRACQNGPKIDQFFNLRITLSKNLFFI